MERHTARAPEPLRARVRAQALAEPPGDSAATLARAAARALERVLAQPGDRAVALDLLAADALVTLALLAEAETAPGRLGEFAVSLLEAGGSDS